VSQKLDEVPILPYEYDSFYMEVNRLFAQTSHVVNDMHLDGMLVWNPVSIPVGGTVLSPPVSVPDAAFSDFVLVSAPYSLQGIVATGYVSAIGVVTICLYNPTGGVLDLAVGTWHIRAMKRHEEIG
jgi:hypothetical protein